MVERQHRCWIGHMRDQLISRCAVITVLCHCEPNTRARTGSGFVENCHKAAQKWVTKDKERSLDVRRFLIRSNEASVHAQGVTNAHLIAIEVTCDITCAETDFCIPFAFLILNSH